MDCISARSLGDVEDFMNVEVRFPGGSRTDRVRLIGFADMERGAVDVGVNCDGSDPHLVACANHSYRNLPPIRDENLLEHQSPSGGKPHRRQSNRTLYWTIKTSGG